jgi:hypothetical protein
MGSHSLGTPSSSPSRLDEPRPRHKRTPCPLLEGQARVWVGADGTASHDPAADERRLRAPRTVGDAAAWAETNLQDGFEVAVQAATTEARRRLQARTEALAAELHGQVTRLRGDLGRWREAERAEAHRRFERTGADRPAQLGLLVDDPDAGELASLDEVLAAIDATFADRAGRLAEAHRVGEVAGPDPVGCLLAVPEALLRWSR